MAARKLQGSLLTPNQLVMHDTGTASCRQQDCPPRGQFVFTSPHLRYEQHDAMLAQLVERGPFKPVVAGSIPAYGTFLFLPVAPAGHRIFAVGIPPAGEAG